MKNYHPYLPRSIGFLCAGLFVLSCSKTDLEPIVEPKAAVPSVTTQLTYEQALQQAIIAVESIGGPQTKSVARRVKNHEVLRVEQSVVTRSANLNSDSLMYIFNFEDNMGFAIIPSDPRTPATIAMSDVGNFNTSGTTSGDTMLTTLLEEHQLRMLGDNFGPVGDLGGEPGGPDVPWKDFDRPKPTRTEYGPMVQHSKMAPMLKTKWSQGSPWNTYVHKNYLAGCVTIATAQIMSYFGLPRDGEGFTYDWNDMWDDSSYNTTCESTQRFIAYVYNHMPNKSPGYTSTSIPDRSVVYCLSDMGYRDDGQEHNYDYNRIVNSLRGGSPVYADGYAKRDYVLGIPFDSKGHAWVIDGQLTCSQEANVYYDIILHDGLQPTPIETYCRHYNYLHCNWGWGGAADGYYAVGVFNTSKGPVYRDEIDTNTLKGDSHYSYDMQIRVNIKP